MLIGLLTSRVSASYHTKCVSLSNQKCMTQHTLFNLHSDQYNQWSSNKYNHPNELHYYLSVVNLDRSAGSYNTMNDLPNKLCVAYKTKDLNTHVANMIIRIKGSKMLTKHVSCECKCKFDCRNM